MCQASGLYCAWGLYARCKKLGVTFVSKNEQFDNSTAMGEAMLKIILVFAELERNMTNERVMATMIARARDKQWNGGRVNGWLLPVCLYLWEQATPQRLPQ